MREFFAIIIFFVQIYIYNTNFLGGTINWKEWRGEIHFTFRTTWALGMGPCGKNCSMHSIGRKTYSRRPFNSTFWSCTSGCKQSRIGGDLNYIITSIGFKPDWEQGEDDFTIRTSDTVFTMSLTSVSWMYSSNSTAKLTTTVDTRVRNDTGKVNASPISALPPHTGIPFGCTSKLILPVIEPDGDVIKCRWAKKTECGDGCTELPHAYIDQNSCVIHMNVTQEHGFAQNRTYRISVMVEDFPIFPIKIGSSEILPVQRISSIPLQFIVLVIQSGSGCLPKLQYITPTPPDNLMASYGMVAFMHHTSFTYSVYLHSSSFSVSFLPSFAKQTNWTTMVNKSGVNYVHELYAEWFPRPQQMGNNLICVWGKDQYGVTSSKRCINALINDADECASNPCFGASSCVNLYQRFLCLCSSGYKGTTCNEKIKCSENPCQHNGKCITVNSSIACICTTGYTGDRCQDELQPCLSFPCKNNGRCVSTAGQYHCHCQRNFTGPNCDKVSITSQMQASKTFNGIVKVFTENLWRVLVGCVAGASVLGMITGFIVWRCRAHALNKVSTQSTKPGSQNPR